MIFVWVMTACHRLRGGIFSVYLHRPPHVADTRRRNTGLRTAATPRGVANYLALGHCLHRGAKHCDAASQRRLMPPNRAQRSDRPSARGGDDDQRRTFPLPREGLQPCVTPYFATRGRGDMRGVPMGIPPNRTPEGCGAVTPNIVHCVSAVYLMIFVWCDDGLPPPPGWHFLGVPPPSPHVADTRRRNTGLRTAATPRGVANYLALGHSSPPRGEALRCRIAATANAAKSGAAQRPPLRPRRRR